MQSIRKWIVAGGFWLVPVISTSALPAQDPVQGEPDRTRQMLVVLGAEGEPQFGDAFRQWAVRWQEAAAGFEYLCIDGTTEEGLQQLTDGEPSLIEHREKIMDWIASASAAENAEDSEHWLILIGHGTHDSKNSHFNLQGPDLSAVDLAKALADRPGKWVVLICASASGPFLKAISGPNRIVVTATKSGAEENYSRFGDFLSLSLADPSTDLDHDTDVSLLEVFLAASLRVEKYYTEQGLLPTEQALIDDNGDGRGTPALFYRGIRAVKSPAEGAALDGPRAHRVRLKNTERTEWSLESQKEIDRLEDAIEELRLRKQNMGEDDYYMELEKLLLRIASLRGFVRP